MEAADPRLRTLSSFALRSFGLDPQDPQTPQDPQAPQTPQPFCSEDQLLLLSSFFTGPDCLHLFIYLDVEAHLSASPTFPTDSASKVICVSRRDREPVTMETVKTALIVQEVPVGGALSCLSAITEQVTCRLLSNPENSHGWAVGVAEEALRLMEWQKNEAQVMKAQVDGSTFLPPPDALHDDHRHDNNIQEDAGASSTVLDMKLVHACESTAIEWAELVSEFLQRDSSQSLLDGLKPPPTDEFHFWTDRLKNLQFIQQQLMSSRAQQVVSILRTADSVYCCTLTDTCRHVQEGLAEAADVTQNLKPLQEKLEEVEQLEYHQLRDNMAAVIKEVCLVWTRSQFYCKPSRIIVLLQKICNLFIHLSRQFLCGEKVMRGLVVDPGPVLDDVRLVIVTLQSLKEVYSHTRTQLDQDQGGLSHSWNFPSHLVFFHLDNFLELLQSIREVYSVSLQLYQLDQAVLSGVSGGMWSDEVQDVYLDFLGHVTVLSSCGCDATDPDDQGFQLHLDQFLSQVEDLGRRLVYILSRALQDCCTPASAAKLLQMFEPVLAPPLIPEQLCPHMSQLLVLSELDQIQELVLSQREKAETFSRFTPSPAARLCWAQQLRLRAQEALKNYKAAQHLCDSGEDQVVQQRFHQVVDLLQDFRDTVTSDWSVQLDSDSGFILEQPLIQHNLQGMLGVAFSQKLEALQRELRYVSKETDVELRPHADRLFTCRNDITQIYLSLSHMMSTYNQVVGGALQVEIPLIQDQLQDLDQSLSELQRNTWSSAGVQQLVEQQRGQMLMFSITLNETRDNMDAMTRIIQGWEQLHLLQRSGDSLLEGGVVKQSYRRLIEDGQELLRLTQVNQSLYGAQDSSHTWIRYLDHIDDKVQDGLFHLLSRSLHFLSDNTNPQTCSAALLAVCVQLLDSGSVFEPSVGGSLSDLMKTIISDVYRAASLLPRISVSCHGNYQESLQQSPDLSALEQEVMRHLLEVREEAEHLRVGLDRYSHLWQSNRQRVMQDFLTYSRQLGPEELDVEKAAPTLKDFKREIDSLHRQYTEVTHLDDVIILHNWLQVDLRPFRDSLLSIIQDWSNMYTEHLLNSVNDRLQQLTQTQCGGDDEDDEESSSSFSLTETLLLLEAAGVQLPEHLSAQLQC